MIAADDADAAVVALVAVARARLEGPVQYLVSDQETPRRAQYLRVQLERAQVDIAAMVGAVQGQQSRLERDEGDGMGCANGATHYTPRI